MPDYRGIGEILKGELERLADSFTENELAYLALTQKVEHAVRDRLAFRLHVQMAAQPDALVCREWKRRDLAILVNGDPALLLELKAFYTFDILKGGLPHNYPDEVNADVAKALACKSKAGCDATEVFTLLLATHAHKAPDQQHRHAVKYTKGIAKILTAKEPIQKSRAEIKRRMSEHPLYHFGEWRGGEAFGVEVSIAYWLFGPYLESTIATSAR